MESITDGNKGLQLCLESPVKDSNSTCWSAMRARREPMLGVLKWEGAWGCTMVPVRKPPPISVPPQYSITGLYPAMADSQWYSSGEDASPVELKHLNLSHFKP